VAPAASFPAQLLTSNEYRWEFSTRRLKETKDEICRKPGPYAAFLFTPALKNRFSVPQTCNILRFLEVRIDYLEV
jgi:hypothetical protein